MLEQIRRASPDLSRAERQVADWVLQHPRRTAESTLSELARACKTSEPTVVRFCRRMGLDGFRALGLRLTESLSSPMSYVHHDVGPDDTTPDAVSKVFDASIQSLIDFRSKLTSMPLEPAVDTLASARQIVFAGLGASGFVARDACHKFFRLGIPCSAISDTPGILQFAAIAGAGDVLVIISHSGRWPEITRAAESARQNGATVIALTSLSSALAEAANLVLNCEKIEDTSVYTPMSSRLAQLALLDAVQVCLALALGPSAADKLKKAKAALHA